MMNEVVQADNNHLCITNLYNILDKTKGKYMLSIIISTVICP